MSPFNRYSKFTVKNIENLPRSLRERGLFCVWRYGAVKGRTTKIPFNPHHPTEKARSNDPSTFARIDVADSIARFAGFDGIGVGIFDRVCAIDIDHCIDDAGTLSTTAQDIVDIMDAYTELSPSGQGVRILFYADAYEKEAYYVKNDNLEVYVSGVTNKYVTVTGDTIRHSDMVERSTQLQIVLDKYMRRDAEQAQSVSYLPGVSTLSDEDLLEKAAAAADGEKFTALWNGDTSAYRGDDSAADMALCSLLSFWSQRDPAQMDRLFRQSKLYRPKWDQKRANKTYGAVTINKAIASTYTVYSPVSKYAFNCEVDNLQPSDFTDYAQALVLVDQYGACIKFCAALGWLVNDDGTHFESNDLKAQRMAQKLTDLQMADVRQIITSASKAEQAAIESDDAGALQQAKTDLRRAKDYRKHILNMRKTPRINAVLKAAESIVAVEVEELDADPFALNTPAGVVDLRTGETRPHDVSDLFTKITTVSPSNVGADAWSEFLDRITCGDPDLATYLQQIAGMTLIGGVYTELLVILLGSGGNGKSTFCDVLYRVLGDYAGQLSADTLTVACRRHKGAELATLRGKRFVVVAELEDGQRMDTAYIKRIVSTDMILGEEKFRTPFSFRPSHTIIQHTNTLSRVGSNDTGTWDRLAVVPFNARLRHTDGEKKNYAQDLFDTCGGAVLQWAIEGAKRFIDADFKLKTPKAVCDAVAAYRGDNDWLAKFVDECCDVDTSASVGAQALNLAYKIYCNRTGEYKKHSVDFKNAMINAGYNWRKTKHGAFFSGLCLKDTAGVYPTGVEGKGDGW